MKILLLGSHYDDIGKFIEAGGDTVVPCEDKIEIGSTLLEGIDFVVSYGYRHIIKEDIINYFKDRIINLHISLLPYNRGADPNLWSFLEDTPKGVSIHLIDKGIDTGDLLIQKELSFSSDQTLKSSYDILSQEINILFKENWVLLKNQRIQKRKQPTGGTSHRLKDKEKYQHLLSRGWDTPVKELIGQALKRGTINENR